MFEATARAAAATVEVCGLSSQTESLFVKTSYYYIFYQISCFNTINSQTKQ